MNEDTRKLLEECNSGCKMAVNSMDQVSEYVENDELKKVIADYRKKHEEIGDKSSELLKECGKPEKDPGVMASVFSWLTSEVKLMMQDDSNQIAKLMMKGSNMGIESITEYKHQYTEASKEAVQIADELVKAEEEFRDKLKQFL